ncbi:MAG: hypothetical protein AB7E32_03135 [Desulfovibrio sp.]
MKKTREECLAALRDTPPILAGQKFVVDDFRPEDALGIARLYYAVYGEGFPVDSVYDPEEMIRLNAAMELHQVVGRAENNDVVGLYAMFRNAPGRRIMEAGSWIVHPDYRTTSLALRLAKRIHLKPPERLGLHVISGQSVCDHVISQKMSVLFKAMNLGLEVEAMPPRPEGEAQWCDGRISLLDQFLVPKDRHQEVYLPERYAAFLRSLYEKHGLGRDFPVDQRPGMKETASSLLRVEQASLVRMTVTRVGEDFPLCLSAALGERPEGHVDQLVLSLAAPGGSMAVEHARKAGFFIVGLLPGWFDHDGFMMQRLACAPDWAAIHVHTDDAKALLEAVRADYETLENRG